jgi:valyl-tRNA synthetase
MINRWILAELSRCVDEVTENLDRYRFNDAAAAIYRFVWNTFCDWYLELLKPVFSGGDEMAKKEAQACTAFVLDEVFKLLHPFMPFMTEELWDATAPAAGRDTMLCHAGWPKSRMADEAAASEVNWLVSLVSEIRSVRSEMGVKPGDFMPLVVVGASAETRARVGRHEPAIHRLARVEPVEFAESAPRGSAQIVLGEAAFCLPLAGVVDLSAEAQRLEKEIKKLDGEIKRLDGKLSNEKFVANAPEDVVAEEREKLAGYRERHARISEALSRVKEAL